MLFFTRDREDAVVWSLGKTYFVFLCVGIPEGGRKRKGNSDAEL